MSAVSTNFPDVVVGGWVDHAASLFLQRKILMLVVIQIEEGLYWQQRKDDDDILI